jgi:hypothetical protein
MTSIITKDIQDIMFDLKQTQCNLEQYITDVDRGINVNHVNKLEDYPKAKTIENLFSYLIDAKNDMDRIKDSLKEIHAKLDDLVDVVEYETLAEKVR